MIAKKSLSKISLLDVMKMLVLAWDEITDKTIQNCFKKAGFSEIEDGDTVSDDRFVALKDSITQLSILEKTFEDVTVEDVASFDDMLVSIQEPLTNKDTLACLLALGIDDQHEYGKDDSRSDVSEVLLKPKPSHLHAAIDTLMNYSMIIGTVELQGLTWNNKLCITKKDYQTKTKKDLFSS